MAAGAGASSKKYGKGTSSSSKKRKFEGGNKSASSVGGGGADVSASNKKRALKHERQSHRRHADSVVTAKEVWNRLRLKTNTREETRELTDELMELLRGKFAEVAMQHDASRVVQAVVQYGTPEQRLDVVKELANADVAGSGKSNNTNSLAELCKVQYAHFVVLKIIKYCFKEAECVRIVVKVSII
jgi:pumilio family protein 6